MYQVIFQKDEKGVLKVIFNGEVNLYELVAFLEIETEKLKKQLVRGIK